jgi:hypothetical protein
MRAKTSWSSLYPLKVAMLIPQRPAGRAMNDTGNPASLGAAAEVFLYSYFLNKAKIPKRT